MERHGEKLPFDVNEDKQNFINRLKKGFFYEPAYGETPSAYLFFKNRYFRLFVYFTMCLLNTIVYYGWQHFSRMLIRAGAYRWNCEDASKLIDRDSYCDSQNNAIQVLFQVGLSSEFIFGVVAGASLDYCGPWITACLGCLSYFAGWMSLMYSSQSVQLYIPGMILMAGAVNLIAFPALCLGDKFPSRSGFMISLVVAAQTTGTFVAPVLYAIWDAYPSLTYQRIIWLYLMIAFVPVTILYLLSVPFSRDVAKTKDQSYVKFDSASDSKSTTEMPVPIITSQPMTNYSESTVVSVEAADEDKKGGNADDLLNDSKADDKQVQQEGSLFSGFLSNRLVKQLLSIDYILFIVYDVLQILQFGYYPTTVFDQYGETISNFQGYMLPTQGLVGAIFGFAVDYTKTLPLCLVLIVMMSGTYVTALIRNHGIQYLSSILYIISNSFIYTVKYTYVAEMYPSDNFGVLIGMIGFVSGVVGLLNIPIQNAGNYFATCIAYALVGLVAAAAVVVLYIRQKRGIQYKNLTP